MRPLYHTAIHITTAKPGKARPRRHDNGPEAKSGHSRRNPAPHGRHPPGEGMPILAWIPNFG